MSDNTNNNKLKQALLAATAMWVCIAIVFFSGMAPASELPVTEITTHES